MVRKKIIYSVLVVVLLLVSGVWMFCCQRGRVKTVLLQADSLMWVNPDSALSILQTIESRSLSGESSAMYGLLMTQARHRCRLTIANDSLISQSVGFYESDSASEALRKAWALYYWGVSLCEQKEQNKALSTFQRAVLAAKDVEDNRLQNRLHYQLGLLLMYELPAEEALKHFDKALYYAGLAKDTLATIYIMSNKARCYGANSRFKESEKCLYEALQIAEEAGLKGERAMLYFELASTMRDTGAYDEAMQCIQKAEKYQAFTPSIYKDNLTIQKVYLYNDMQMPDSAQKYLMRIEPHDNVGWAVMYYEKSRIERSRANYEKALCYHEKYAAYNDSVHEESMMSNYIGLQKKFDHSLVLYENEKLRADSLRQRLIFLLVVLVVLSISGYMVYLSLRRRKQSELMLSAKDAVLAKVLLQMQIKSEELATHIRNEEKLKQSISDKESEMEGVLQRFREERIKQLNDAREREHSLKNQIFQMSAVAQKINALKDLPLVQKLKHKRTYELSGEEGRMLVEAINSCFDGYVSKLCKAYPMLTSDDVLLICLLYMGVSNVDISLVLSLTDSALKKRKYRIKKEKLNMSSNEQSLEDFLHSFAS